MAHATPGFAIWFTGLPASGKSTLAVEVQRLLDARGIATVIIDSDELRRVLTPQPRYTAGERDWFYGVIAYLAAWLTASGVNVLIAATAHQRVYRDRARAQIARFAEVYVACPIEVCEQRDPKGIYARLRSGQTHDVPGKDVPYEPPLTPEVVIASHELAIDRAARTVVDQLHNLLQQH